MAFLIALVIGLGGWFYYDYRVPIRGTWVSTKPAVYDKKRHVELSFGFDKILHDSQFGDGCRLKAEFSELERDGNRFIAHRFKETATDCPPHFKSEEVRILLTFFYRKDGDKLFWRNDTEDEFEVFARDH